MPPKAKKGRKNKKPQKIVIDEVDTTTLNRKKLEEFCISVNLELNDEKRNSELLRLERDKLVNMVALSGEELKILRGNNRQLQIDFINAEDEHRIVMANNRQKVIHLRNELENKSLHQYGCTMNIISEERQNHDDIATLIIRDTNVLTAQQIRIENEFQAVKNKMEHHHAEDLNMIREKDKQFNIITELRREKAAREDSAQLQTLLTKIYNSFLRLKEKQYRTLLEMNAKKTTHLEHYYNRILKQNQDIMEFINNNLQTMKESLGKIDKQYFKLKVETQKLSEELTRLGREKKILKDQMTSSQQHKYELKSVQKELNKKKKMLENIKLEDYVQDMIEKKGDDIVKEENDQELKSKFQSISITRGIALIYELFMFHIYHKINEIDSTLSEIKDIYEKKGKQNDLLIYVSEYHDPALDVINYEILETIDKRKDMFRAYKKMLRQFNIPFENTGFKPLNIEEMLAKIGNTRFLVNENSLLLNQFLC